MHVVRGDAVDAASVAAAVRRAGAVVSAVAPGHSGEPATMVVAAARALIEGAKRSGVRRLVVIGGAGSLEVAPGQRLLDTADFPVTGKELALAHAEALAVLRGPAAVALAWTYVSPAAVLRPGARTGRYRIGGGQLLTDAKGDNTISVEDFAVAVLDELEQPVHVRKRMTVAY